MTSTFGDAPGNPAEVGHHLIGANGVVVIIPNDPGGVGVGGVSIGCHGRTRMRVDNKGGGWDIFFMREGVL
jgi:hypothetical protein